MEPDIVASIKERPVDLTINDVASPESQPPPVAPPRRKKKRKPVPEVGGGVSNFWSNSRAWNFLFPFIV